MKRKTPESGVLRACLDLLAAEKIWHCRMNSGAFLPRGPGKGIIRAGKPGMADILAIPKIDYGCPMCTDDFRQPLWIECKSATGKQRPTQKEFQAEVEASGHSYLIVWDVNQLIEWLAEHNTI